MIVSMHVDLYSYFHVLVVIIIPSLREYILWFIILHIKLYLACHIHCLLLYYVWNHNSWFF